MGITTKSFDSFKEFKTSESRDFFFQASGNLEKSKSVIIKYDDNIKFDGMNSKIPVQIDGDNFGNFKEVLISKSEKKINILK